MRAIDCPLEFHLWTDGQLHAMLMIEPLTLRSGAKMPVVGLGTWKIPREACKETVLEAIRTGYRHLDCACDYGNEAHPCQCYPLPAHLRTHPPARPRAHAHRTWMFLRH